MSQFHTGGGDQGRISIWYSVLGGIEPSFPMLFLSIFPFGFQLFTMNLSSHCLSLTPHFTSICCLAGDNGLTSKLSLGEKICSKFWVHSYFDFNWSKYEVIVVRPEIFCYFWSVLSKNPVQWVLLTNVPKSFSLEELKCSYTHCLVCALTVCCAGGRWRCCWGWWRGSLLGEDFAELLW